MLGRRSGAGGCQRLHFRRDLGHADGDSGDQGRHFVDAELGNPGLLEQRIGEALGAETEREATITLPTNHNLRVEFKKNIQAKGLFFSKMPLSEAEESTYSQRFARNQVMFRRENYIEGYCRLLRSKKVS